MSPGFHDHFGGVAGRYAAARPTYPDELFAWLAGQVTTHERVWDCGAGSGQASHALARYFTDVVATDASASQLAQARRSPAVTYRVAPAEASGLMPESVSLVAIAQALHWFPLDPFYTEVRRVVRPGGVIAAWTYAAFSLADAEADAIVGAYHRETMRTWWPAGRRHVETGYREMPFPFARLATPPFRMTLPWTLPQVTEYLRSWSATAAFMAARGADPVDEVEMALRQVWGDPTRTLDVTWPLTVLAGRV